MLALLATRQEAIARTVEDSPILLSPEAARGFAGSPGIQVHRRGRDWAAHPQIESVVVDTDDTLIIVSRCRNTGVEVTHRLQLEANSDVVVASTELRNLGDAPLSVDACYAPTLPLPDDCSRITGFEGRWSGEFRTHCVERFAGAYVRENRAGRTSHDSFPGLFVHQNGTDEASGVVYAMHFGWSGNHRMRVEELSDGRVYAQFGELFFPGEITLDAGDSYRSPEVFGVCTDAGFSAASRRFHRYVRGQLIATRMRGKAKPVHFNSWEAMYFDLDELRLKELASAAAAIGVERFVLDDGWFRNRRSDAAGLGDWYVDAGIFPNGLGPLVDHVRAAGMEFGLWVEPEMVNEDSDLYRQHPEWALQAPGVAPVMARHQLVLDLTRAEVREYLFQRIDALLSEYPIAYLKWDMNRDLSQPGGHDGRVVTHRQVLALYALLERIRASHPAVEIESCASGGGRADFGILRYTDRIWTSDNNDAIERLLIQRGFSRFFPAELMGAHVGPEMCHVTGRRISMATRCGVAMFGDMGIEANLLDMTREELDELTAGVALHKKHRALLFGGDLHRLDTEGHENAFGVVSVDRREALFSYALIESQHRSAPGRLRLRGLQRDALYAVDVIWPRNAASHSASILDVISKAPFSGDSLMSAGLQLPIMHPQNLLVLHLEVAG